jgi:hypothetical protein
VTSGLNLRFRLANTSEEFSGRKLHDFAFRVHWRQPVLNPSCTRKNLTTCQQDALQQACSITMLLFYQVATRLSLTTCYQIVELQDDNKLVGTTCNKAVELNNLVASCQQAVDNFS